MRIHFRQRGMIHRDLGRFDKHLAIEEPDWFQFIEIVINCYYTYPSDLDIIVYADLGHEHNFWATTPMAEITGALEACLRTKIDAGYCIINVHNT